MSVAEGVPSVVHAINSFVDKSSFAVMAPIPYLVAHIFTMMFLWLCVLISSAHAHVIDLCMQTSCVASDVIWTL